MKCIAFAAFIAFAASGLADIIRSVPSPSGKKDQDQDKQSYYNAESSPTESGEGGKEESDSGSKVEKNQDGWWSKFIEWTAHNDKAIVALSTVVIATFTLALFGATFLLWWAGERHSERELRAYLFLKDITLSNFGSTTERVEATISFRNCGATPAHSVNIRAAIDLVGLPRTDFSYPATGPSHIRSQSSIGPDVEVDAFRRLLRPVNQGEYNAVLSGKVGLFVFGEASYMDAFGKKRYTRFRYVQTGTGDLPLNSLPLLAAEDGNEAT